MINNTDIDLTENNDFGKKDPLIVHVKNGIINHPRIPWKINKERSYLKGFYNTDGDFDYTMPTIAASYDLMKVQFLGIFGEYLAPYHTTSININSDMTTYTTTYTYNGTNTWTTKLYYTGDSKSTEYTDIFGLNHKKSLHIHIPRIPHEVKSKTKYTTIFDSNRLPKIFKHPKKSYYGYPNELFYEHPMQDNNHDMYKNERYYYKGIPWLDRSKHIRRVGERQSDRGVIMFYE